MQSKDKAKYEIFHSHSKTKLSMKVTLMIMYLNQSMLQLHQTCKTFLEKVQPGLLT